MRQYFEPQARSMECVYFERCENPGSIAPTELYIRTISQYDVDVLASEFKFVELIYDRKSGFNIPILKRL